MTTAQALSRIIAQLDTLIEQDRETLAYAKERDARIESFQKGESERYQEDSALNRGRIQELREREAKTRQQDEAVARINVAYSMMRFRDEFQVQSPELDKALEILLCRRHGLELTKE